MKDGIILINKPKGMTSRDVVNIISKKLNTRKVGHTGTLDPLATGLMVICVNKATKLVEMLTGHDKEYIATVKLGIKTDTYDITGKVLEENNNYHFSKEKLEKTLKAFQKTYWQEVPIYSSVKINGHKLYEYARNNQEVELPKREVTIKDIRLLEYKEDSFSFYVSVSKGTYIRSLINDISDSLKIPMAMQELKRISVGNFKLENAFDLTSSLESSILDIKDCLEIPIVKIEGDLLKKVLNGAPIFNSNNQEIVLFVDGDNNNIAIYKKNDKNMLSAYKVF